MQLVQGLGNISSCANVAAHQTKLDLDLERASIKTLETSIERQAGHSGRSYSVKAEMPRENQSPGSGSLVRQNSVIIELDIGQEENKSQHLREIEHVVSRPWLGSKTRQVLSQVDLHHTFDASCSSDRLPCSETIDLSNPADMETRHLRDTEISPSSSGCSRGARRLLHSPPQGDFNLYAKYSPGNPNTIKSEQEPDSVRTKGYMDGLVPGSDAHEDRMRAIKVASEKSSKAAEAKKVVLQNRIAELESCKAMMEDELESKKVAMQQAITTSLHLQQNNNELKKMYEDIAKESEESNCSALNHQTSATLAAVEEKNVLQQELSDVLNTNRALLADLTAAQELATFCERRMKALNYALAQSPNEIANLSGVIALKDKMFSDVDRRAKESSLALHNLEKKSDMDRRLARQETVVLKAELEKNQRTIAELWMSREVFQGQCEAILAMQRKKVRTDDLITAMDGYFQTVLHDNSVLKSEIQRQACEISSQNLKVVMHEAAMEDIEKTLKAEKESNNELRLALSTKDIEFGALEVELNSVHADHQSIIDEKDRQLADADQRVQNAFDAIENFINEGLDERQRLLIQRKDEKIAALEKRCQRLSSSCQTLEIRLQTQLTVSKENAWAESAHRAELEDAQVQLRAAQEYIEHQKDRLRDLGHLRRDSRNGAMEDPVIPRFDKERDGDDDDSNVFF
ncbi:hypothetical protein MMC07_003743 [Pseudocyphellaria aurata]|nr:hypothetical protein [Pseudocyphellaria aurata]